MGITLPDNVRAGQGAELAELVIRRLAAADWAAFRAVRLAALWDAPEAFGSTSSDAEQLDEAEWRRRVEGRAAFLAEVAGQHAGLAAGIAADHPAVAELISMWVAPAWRGQGVGDRLVEAVLTWPAGERFATVHLWVADGNARAERLVRPARVCLKRPPAADGRSKIRPARIRNAPGRRLAQVADGGGPEEARGQGHGGQAHRIHEPPAGGRQAQREGGTQRAAESRDQPERPAPATRPGQQDTQEKGDQDETPHHPGRHRRAPQVDWHPHWSQPRASRSLPVSPRVMKDQPLQFQSGEGERGRVSVP
jgi:GNAT superfamily N-acetyltransferase